MYLYFVLVITSLQNAKKITIFVIFFFYFLHTYTSKKNQTQQVWWYCYEGVEDFDKSVNVNLQSSPLYQVLNQILDIMLVHNQFYTWCIYVLSIYIYVF